MIMLGLLNIMLVQYGKNIDNNRDSSFCLVGTGPSMCNGHIGLVNISGGGCQLIVEYVKYGLKKYLFVSF